MRLAVLIAVITVAVLMLAAAVGPYFVPTKTYRRAIEEALADRLDARVAIDRFRLRLIPYPSYTIEGFRLVSKAPPFQGMPVFEADKVIGSLSFGALFGGELDTDVEARDVRIFYRATGGVSNVGMMFRLASAAASDRAAEPPPRQRESGDERTPATPGEDIQSMPAPSIETPSGDGGASLLLPALSFVRSAWAAAGADEGGGARLGRLAIVRGRIEVDTDDTPQPLVVEGVSAALRDINLDAGFSAAIKATGRIADEAHTPVGAEGSIGVDRARGEVTFRNARAYVGGMQLAGDGTISYALAPASFDVHAASPNLSEAVLAPLLSSLGWMVPAAISWQGALAADATFKGTSEAGQFGLQIDATAARLSVGGAFAKEAGFPFKLQADVLVKPESYALADGTLSLEGGDLALSGDAARVGDLTVRLTLSGAALALGTMKSLLPWFPDADALEGGTAEMVFSGSLYEKAALGVSGRIGALRLAVAGAELADVDAAFLKEGDRVEFTTLAARYEGGKLSGNGVLTHESGGTAIDVDVVIGDLEMKSIEALSGAVEGAASVVAKATCSGADRFALAQSLAIAGSLVASEAKLSGWQAAGGLFSESMWQVVTQQAGAAVGGAAAKELTGLGPEVKDLRISFAMNKDGIAVEEIAWQTRLYAAKLRADVDSAGRVAASGTIAVDKATSARLVADPEARKKLLNAEGWLILPVKGEGKPGALNLSLSAEDLSAMIETRQKPRPMLEGAGQEQEKKEEKDASAASKASAEEAAVKAIKAPAIEVEPAVPATAPTPETSPAEAPAEKERQVVSPEKVPAVTTAEPAKKEETKSAAPAADAKPAQSPAKKAGPPAAESPAGKKPARKRAEPSVPNQPVEDILKVIIGD